jgi:hypothetical protein
VDAITGMVTAAGGIRAALGRFCQPAVQVAAIEMVEAMAVPFAAVARLEAGAGSAEEKTTPDDILRDAAWRRLKSLGLPDACRPAVEHVKDICTPGACSHLAMILAVPDRDAVLFATKRAEMLAKAAAASRTEKTLRKVAEEGGCNLYQTPSGFFLGPGMAPDEPPPPDATDDEDD